MKRIELFVPTAAVKAVSSCGFVDLDQNCFGLCAANSLEFTVPSGGTTSADFDFE
jgi:hypothetical protein